MPSAAFRSSTRGPRRARSRRLRELARAVGACAGVLLPGALALGAVACGSTRPVDMDAHRAGPTATRPAVEVPDTARGDQVDDYHGTAVADPYRWLEDPDAPATRAWIEAQNAATFGYLEALPGRARIEARLTELSDYERYSAPFRRGARVFFRRNDGLQNQSVLYVQDGPRAEPRVLIDPNEFSEDGTVALAGLSPSDDGELLAYSTSSGGSDWQEWRVVDVTTGDVLTDVIPWCKFTSPAWAPDRSGFYYARYPAPREGDELEQVNENQRLFFHALGTDPADDRLVYERPDEPRFGFSPAVTDDGRYLVVAVWSGTDSRNRVYYRDLEAPADSGPDAPDAMVRLLDEFDASYDFLGNVGETFYFRTDRDAPRGRIVAVDLARPEPESWREVVPEVADKLQGASLVHRQLVLSYLHDATSRVRIHDLDGRLDRELPLPGLGTAAGFSGRIQDTQTFFTFTSFLQPPSIWSYDFDSGELEVFRRARVDFAFDRYEERLLFARSPDGTAVPLFVVARRGLERDGSHPALLYGYGGFNVAMTPRFSVFNLAWLEMGGVYVQAVLRGGSEYGQAWHEAGMLGNKQNVFDDFVAAGEFLVEQGYTSPERLAIRGGSNGGLLVGAVLNQRPDLFGAAIPAVGVMDMLRYHLFTIGWAWVPEYGSSEDAEQFPWLHAYSPLHNVREGAHYPAVLITTGDHDDRVVPAHSFKYAAALQRAQAGPDPVLIRIETRAGHGAGKPTAMIIEEQADVLAFLADALAPGGS